LKPPFEQLIEQSLKDFEAHLRAEGMTSNTRTDRMKGAREFAVFLLGRPHKKGEITKGRI
jgi:hypothetical protein